MSGDDSYLQHCELLFEQILSEEGTRLPSARRYANRLRTPETGVQVRAPALSLSVCPFIFYLYLICSCARSHVHLCVLMSVNVCVCLCLRL